MRENATTLTDRGTDCTGTIGFLATYWAVRRLYGAIRVD